MKLFISLIASFFLIAGCGGNEEETRAGDTDTSIPVLANCTQSDGSTLDLLAGSFDCPQVASYNCSVCRLNSSVAMNGNTNVILAYTCTDSIGSVGLTDAASFIQQLGITCSKAAEIETEAETTETETEAETTETETEAETTETETEAETTETETEAEQTTDQ